MVAEKMTQKKQKQEMSGEIGGVRKGCQGKWLGREPQQNDGCGTSQSLVCSIVSPKGDDRGGYVQ